MDDLMTLALDAALRLDQRRRGHDADTAPVSALGFRYASPDLRRAARHRAAHLRALAAIDLTPLGECAADHALAAVGLDLMRAAGGEGEPGLEDRCRDFCLALHEGLRDEPALPRAA